MINIESHRLLSHRHKLVVFVRLRMNLQTESRAGDNVHSECFTVSVFTKQSTKIINTSDLRATPFPKILFNDPMNSLRTVNSNMADSKSLSSLKCMVNENSTYFEGKLVRINRVLGKNSQLG